MLRSDRFPRRATLQHITRRRFIQTGATGAAALATQGTKAIALDPARTALDNHLFRHRGYLGWITDLATAPDPHAAWPSIRLDEQLLRDYAESFRLMKAVGYNEMSVWGLYTSWYWPTDIKSCVTPERGAMVERLLELARENGIRVYSGLGVYASGFDAIIEANPQLHRGGSRHTMCGSLAESWTWMRRVVDFMFERFPIDGVSMQSADQGRCDCDECRVHSDAEYHAMLNIRVADYIRRRWPGKTVAVNSWGMNFSDRSTRPALENLSRHIDYLIDVHNTSQRSGRDHRKELIGSLECAFGTIGGPQVEPPQHWRRDRWFLPIIRRVGEHLEALYADGGRACEYFFHILANPADEVSFRVAAHALADPATPWEKHLHVAVDETFAPKSIAARDALCELLLEAEDAYFAGNLEGYCGTISMEPLVSDRPGPPVYLRRLKPDQLAAYQARLQSVRTSGAKLTTQVDHTGKLETALRCMDNVIVEVARVRSEKRKDGN
jgi:hypothetical protein